MAKNKEQEALYKAEGRKRMLIRKQRRQTRFIVKKERLAEFGGNCCEYGNSPYCDWSC